LPVAVDDLGKGAAVEAEKFKESLQRGFDFRDDLVNGNVRKAGGKIGKQTFKRQKFFQRWRRSAARRRPLIARNPYFLGPPWLYLLPVSAPPSEAARRTSQRRTARSTTFWHGYIFRMLQ
jgi:hypothetical protein